MTAPEPLHYSTPAQSTASLATVHRVAKAVTTGGRGLLPAQTRAAAVMCAEHPDGRPEFGFVGVCIPRRSGKTTTMLTVALARMIARPGLRVAFTAQTLLKARDRFIDLVGQLDASGLAGHKVRLAQGSERITLANGSELHLVSPRQDAFRSAAYDLIILDEAQEHDRDARTDLLAGVLPTLDTRPHAQLLVAGTAGPRRDSLLWDALGWGREGRWGIVEYAATEDADLEDEDVWRRVHPGLAEGLTTIDRIRMNRQALGAEQFAREYLGLWPDNEATGGLSQEVWDTLGLEHAPLPEDPSRLAVAFDVSPAGDRATVCAAYADDNGLPRIEVMESRPGVDWLVDFLVPVSDRWRAPIGYDSGSKSALGVADKLAQQRLRSKLVGLTTTDYAVACQRFTSDVLEGKLRHARQPDLTAAVLGATRRPIGDAGYGWGRRASGVDITPLVAASVALFVSGTLKRRRAPLLVAANDGGFVGLA